MVRIVCQAQPGDGRLGQHGALGTGIHQQADRFAGDAGGDEHEVLPQVERHVRQRHQRTVVRRGAAGEAKEEQEEWEDQAHQAAVWQDGGQPRQPAQR